MSRFGMAKSPLELFGNFPSAALRQWQKTEDHPDPTRFNFNLPFTDATLHIVERNVGRTMEIAQSMLNPGNVLDEFCGAYSREANPEPSFIQRQYPPAPTQGLI